MKELVDRLKDLLKESFPEVLESLNPGASDIQIDNVEKSIGFKIPQEVVELYKIHDGQSGDIGLFCGLPFLSLSEAMLEWETWKEVFDEGFTDLDTNIISIPSGYIKEVYANKYYFPISKDYGGNNIVIDMDPDERGRVGQIINSGRDEEMRYVIGLSLTDFIKFIIHQLENKNIRIEKDEEYTNWFLKSPENSHFLDTLKDLELPHGLSLETNQNNGANFDDWFNSISNEWRGFISNNCGIPLSWDKVQKVKSLSILKQGFTDISPVEKFVGLRELILSGNPVSDLSPVRGLKDLKTIYIAKTLITSINDLFELPGLAQLSLGNTRVSSLDGLSSLKKLKSLSIESCLIPDLKEIGRIKSLTVLDISKNKFDSFEPLQDLKNLTELKLSNTNIKSLEVLCGLDKLESIEIYNTEVSDFNLLSTLVKLKRIMCSYNDFVKIREIVKPEVNFGICGEITDVQEEEYLNYCRNK